jgi:(p)ppGpp synthase/HD superfamily hydrolase
MKSEVFQNRVYVFTPKGDVIDLPEGSTPIDFAYYIHTDVGHRCRGAKINGKQVGLDYILKTGDQVQILTAKRGGRAGLAESQSQHGQIGAGRARSSTGSSSRSEENIVFGKALLEKGCAVSARLQRPDRARSRFQFQPSKIFMRRWEAVTCRWLRPRTHFVSKTILSSSSRPGRWASPSLPKISRCSA